MVSKKFITKKIIRTKIHTIGKRDIFMNKYKLLDKLSNNSKSVENYFDLNDKLNSLEEILQNTNDRDLIVFQTNVDILKRNDDAETVGVFDNVEEIITYPNAFSPEDVQIFQMHTSEICEEMGALEFSKNVVQRKKEEALKIFDLKKAIKCNDQLVKLNEKISKLTEKLKNIANQILKVEDNFIAIFNRLVLDIKDKKIAKNITLGSLIEEYSAEVIKEYLIRAKIALAIQIFEGIEVSEIVQVLENSSTLQKVLSDDFAPFINGIKYVGTNL